MTHDFHKSLARSHAAEDLPFWEEAYRKAFPTMQAMVNHRQDGDHQRQGIDRSIVLENSKQILIDEKVRWRNEITGIVYEDILLETWSNFEQKIPGWVRKPLLCDYIAYAIAPLGKCFLLPVLQLQAAFQKHAAIWRSPVYRLVMAKNDTNGRRWTTHSIAVPVAEVFSAIGECLRVSFTPTEKEDATPGQEPVDIQETVVNEAPMDDSCWDIPESNS